MAEKIKTFAPVALFVYNRPWHTRKTLESLAENDFIDQSELYVFADGPKKNASEDDLRNLDEVRKIIQEINFGIKTHLFLSEFNKGLANSIINGINQAFRTHDRIIVVEDDLILQKGFLKFLNEGLELYKDEPGVMHIGAYMHDLKGELPETVMTKLMTCWGWGTWKGSWMKFNPSASDLLRQIPRKDRYEFDFERSYNNIRMLKKNKRGENDSWAIRWYASIFLENGLCYSPTRSLTKNIGHDASGTHSYKSGSHHVNPVNYVKAEKIPIQENIEVRKKIINYYWRLKVKEIPNYLRYLLHKKLKGK